MNDGTMNDDAMNDGTVNDDAMNKENDRPLLWAYLLLGLGGLFLATNLGWFSGIGGWLWPLLFLAGGGGFLYLYNADRSRWWALIPGFGLLAVGVAALSGDAAGGLFLGTIGLGFLAVFLGNRSRWWAVIPAGTLFTLAVIAWLDTVRPAGDFGWIFFLGLALTFGVLFSLPEEGRQRWAVYPALGALAFAGFTFVASDVGGVLLPLALIAVGLAVLWRRGRPRGRGPSSPSGA